MSNHFKPNGKLNNSWYLDDCKLCQDLKNGVTTIEQQTIDVMLVKMAQAVREAMKNTQFHVIP